MNRLLASESSRVSDKSPDAFRTISEVADDLDVPQHVLRFWETRFPQIKPLKRGGGRRYYRPDDVDLLKGIRHLLYGEGYTIKGVQRILKEEGGRFVQAVGRGEQTVAAPQATQDGDEDLVEISEDAADPPVATATGREGHTLPALSEAGTGLSDYDVKCLKAALDELLECERVLASLKTADDSPQG